MSTAENLETMVIDASMFNFANVADLPEALQEGVNTDRAAKVNKIVAILDMAPGPLSLAEIRVVYFRAYGEEPSKATLRAYLNKAVKEGKACKPSKQTYAKAVEGAEAVTEVEEVAAESAATDIDPVAELDTDESAPAMSTADAEIVENNDGDDDLLGDL